MRIEDRIGALDPARQAEVPGTRPDRADQISADDELLVGLAALAPLAEPPQGLLAAIDAEIDALPSMPIETLRADEGKWIKLTDKIWQKILSSNSQTGQKTYLLRCDPGAVIPAHKHPHEEHSFMIEGEAWMGDAVLRAGDFQVAQAGSRHPAIKITTGCLLLVHA